MNFNNEISPAKGDVNRKERTGIYCTPVDNSKAGNFVMRKCKVCDEFKDVSKFTGYYKTCNSCRSAETQARKKTKHGVANVIYNSQKTACKKRGVEPPSYSFKEFEEWLFNQERFDELYIKWVVSNYNRWSKPSVDRINSNLSYSFDNIQLLTWWENMMNGVNDRRKIKLQYYGN